MLEPIKTKVFWVAGFLFEERLRVNPKLTKHEMVAEILREYKLEVTPDQCAKAKTKVLRARRASHDSHFARIWDYQAEVLLRNPGTEFNIETVAGAVIGSKGAVIIRVMFIGSKGAVIKQVILIVSIYYPLTRLKNSKGYLIGPLPPTSRLPHCHTLG